MKQRKKWIIFTACTIVSLLVALVLCLIFIPNSKRPNEKMVNQLLNEKIAQEMFIGDDLPLSYQYLNAVVSFTKYKVRDISLDNIATIQFEYINVIKMADDYTGSSEDADAFYLYCIEKINDGSAYTISKEIEVALELDESTGTYFIVDCVELANALTGGIASEYIKILNGRK